MSIIKRLTATVASRIDQVVGEIENHDAVIQANLNDMRKKIAEARQRLNQVHKEEEKLSHQIQEQQDNTQRWRQRAVECAKSDEAKALECVRRGRHCQQQTEILKQSLTHYQQTAAKLAQDISTSEQRMTEVKHKLTLMRARQSTSSALNAASAPNNDPDQLLASTFDRWEINISDSEMAIEAHNIPDLLENEFITNEQQDELRSELAELLAKEEQS